MNDVLPWVMALGMVFAQVFTVLQFNRGARFREQDAARVAQDRLDQGIKALDEKLSERIEARSAVQDKARHDAVNNLMGQIHEQRRDLADLNKKAVTREDMTGFKAEMKADFSRLEAKLDRLLENRGRASSAAE